MRSSSSSARRKTVFSRSDWLRAVLWHPSSCRNWQRTIWRMYRWSSRITPSKALPRSPINTSISATKLKLKKWRMTKMAIQWSTMTLIKSKSGKSHVDIAVICWKSPIRLKSGVRGARLHQLPSNTPKSTRSPWKRRSRLFQRLVMARSQRKTSLYLTMTFLLS